MHLRSVPLTLLMAAVVLVSGCRPPPKELSPDVENEVKKLQEQKNFIAEKLRDIERSRALLEANTDEELRKIREQLELVQISLTSIEKSLAALGAVDDPMTEAKRRRLPLEVSIVLFVVFVCSALLYWRMRSLRLREARQSRAKGVIREVPKEPSES